MTYGIHCIKIDNTFIWSLVWRYLEKKLDKRNAVMISVFLQSCAFDLCGNTSNTKIKVLRLRYLKQPVSIQKCVVVVSLVCHSQRYRIIRYTIIHLPTYTETFCNICRRNKRACHPICLKCLLCHYRSVSSAGHTVIVIIQTNAYQCLQ